MAGLDFAWCQAPDRGLPCPDGIFFLHIDEKVRNSASGVVCIPNSTKWEVGASRSNFGDERYENAEMQAAWADLISSAAADCWCQARVRAQFKDPRLRANVNWKDVNGARDMEAGPPQSVWSSTWNL